MKHIAIIIVLLAGINQGAGAEEENSPVLLVGDSMMKLPGLAVRRQLSKTSDIQARAFSGIGTGLSRLDAFDWLGKMSALCEKHKPVVAVVALGTNDRQPMRLATGVVVQPGDGEWDKEYGRRIGKAMDILIDGGCRKVIWLQLPVMRDDKLNTFVKKINRLIAKEADLRDAVEVFDVGPVVADPRTGGFTERLLNRKTASTMLVRDRDGIHLSPQGAILLAEALIKAFWE